MWEKEKQVGLRIRTMREKESQLRGVSGRGSDRRSDSCSDTQGGTEVERVCEGRSMTDRS